MDPARGDRDFTELLRSMWSEEEEEEEEEDGGREGEEGGEATPGASEGAAGRRDDDGSGQRDRRLASGDGDAHEEPVNDEEMEEIYEFAATQRKLAEERDSTEEEGGGVTREEEEEEEEEEEGGPTSTEDHVLTKAGGPEHDEPPVGPEADAPERSPGCQVPSSLSYSRLFSGSWDVCEEEFPASPRLPSPQPSTSRGLPQAATPPPPPPPPPRRQSPGRAFPRGDGTPARTADATCLQSSPSEVIDLSDSPGPLSELGLPLPGLSPPGRHRTAPDVDSDASGDGPPGNHPATDPGASPKRESRGPRSICPPAPPEPPRRRVEPELIVLSDSSEEMDEGPVPAASPGPTPPLSPGPTPPLSPGPTPPLSPVWTQRHQQYTQIKAPSLHPGPGTSPTARGAEEGGGDGGQGSACAVVDQSPDQLGFSPEVSWLIPATPLQASRSTTTSSICTQTQSSMFRTRLFPRASASISPSPPPTPSSSPRSKGRGQTSGSRPPTDGPPAKGSVNRTSAGESKGSESSLDDKPMPGTLTPLAQDHARPPGFPRLLLSSPSSTKGTPTHGHPGPYSSTPLHTQPPKPPGPLETSLVPGDPAREELGCGHLSGSDPSRSRSLSPLCNGRSGANRDADSGRCRRTLGSDHHHGNTVDPEKSGDADESVRNEGRESGAEGAVGRGGEAAAESESEGGGHERVSEPSFCQSFMDEPPMAFNDSWGLDAGGGGGEGDGGQVPCFSLRLEDSGEAGSHQHSPVSPHSPHSHLTPSHSRHREHNPSASRSPGTPPPPTARPSVDPDTLHRGPEVNGSLLDPQLWDSWQEVVEEEGEEQAEALPLSQRGNPKARFQTPGKPSSHTRRGNNPCLSDASSPGLEDGETPAADLTHCSVCYKMHVFIV